MMGPPMGSMGPMGTQLGMPGSYRSQISGTGMLPSGPMGMMPSGPMGMMPSGPMGMMPSGPMGMMPSGPMGMTSSSPMVQYSRPSIMMQELPNMNTLDSRPTPPFPTPWRPKEYLMPGQPTGTGVNSINPLQERAVGDLARLPSAYRMYGYGPREITWSPHVPVPFPGEENTGIMINAEFPLPRTMEGREAIPYDLAIRNPTWRHQGMWVQPFDPLHDVPDWKHKLFGDYESAQDIIGVPGAQKRYLQRNLAGESAIEQHYKKLHEQRNQQGLFKDEDAIARKHMELEILDEQELEDFFRNPDAVMRDKLD